LLFVLKIFGTYVARAVKGLLLAGAFGCRELSVVNLRLVVYAAEVVGAEGLGQKAMVLVAVVEEVVYSLRLPS
jgi:hypothetical protein